MRHECIIRAALILGLIIGVTVDLAFSEPRFGAIKGEVVADSSGNPIVNATVRLEPSGKSVTTNATGGFAFTDVPPGMYSLKVSHPDFSENRMAKITVRGGETIEIEVRLYSPDLRHQSAPAALNQPQEQRKDESKEESEKSDGRGQPTPDALTGSMFDALTKGSRLPDINSSNDYFRTRERDNLYVSPPNDMFFRDYGTNGFVSTSRDRFSTFAVDVDDASFNIARQYLLDGHMPPTEAIRVEEFVNHFDYGYATPTDGRFRVFSELTSSPFDRRTHFVKIGVKAKEIAEERRKPVNLTVVLDVSGSMGYGNRMDLVKQSLELLIGQLDAGDMVGVVAYGSHAWVVLEPTSAAQHRRIMKVINKLSPNGSTYAEAGLKLGFQMANQQWQEGYSNLVILCSDGVANVGQTSPDAIMREITRFAERGITLSTFGFGMGNYNDVLLERLAQQGNGRYAYVNDREQARTLFIENIMGGLQVVARDVKIQVEFNPSVVSSYRLLGYENRAIADKKFRDNRQDGGEVGSGHEVTALYEITMQKHTRSNKLATVIVRWKNPRETRVTELSREVVVPKSNVRFAAARPELKLAILAAKFAEVLKETQYSDRISFGELSELAQSINRQLATEQTRELVSLIGRAENLTGYFGHYRDADDNYDDDDD